MTFKFPKFNVPFLSKGQKSKINRQTQTGDSLENELGDFETTSILVEDIGQGGVDALQSDTISALDTSVPTRGSAKRKGFAIPLIGGLPLATQIRALGTVIFGALAIAFFMMWMDSRITSDSAINVDRISSAMLQSQRLAKETQGALTGQPEAFQRIRDSAAAIDSVFGQLKGAEVSSGATLPAEIMPTLNKAESIWNRLKSDALSISSAENAVINFALTQNQFDSANKKLGRALEAIADQRMQRRASGSEVGAYKQMVLISQRMANSALDLANMTSSSEESIVQLLEQRKEFTQLLGAFVEGTGPFAVKGNENGQLFQEILEAEKSRADAISKFEKTANLMATIKSAAQSSTDQAEDLLAGLQELKTTAQDLSGVTAWTTGITVAFLMLALLSAMALSKAYVDDSRKKAVQAESQKTEAERLEQDAKRTNDQNQAAILRLMNELQEVADGDLTVQVSVSEDITGAIADSVNYTVEELRSLVARINRTATSVSESSARAQQISSGLLAASEQQSREIRDTGESVLRLADSIHRVSANALESAKVARQSLQAAEQGADAVHRTISGMGDIREQIQETAKRIKRLGESSQEIGEIVELISDITEQTNVLALNAAIQAASAGEAGRGFTVVAEEVQRLAERSGEATKQISTLIKTIQSDTQDAVAAMERSTQNVVEGAKLSDDAGRALGEIGAVSRQLAELIESISVTTNREASSAGTVAQSIQRILLVTEQTTEGTQQTASSVGQLTELAQDLRNSVTRFKVA